MKNDLAPCLLKVRKKLIDMSAKLRIAPYNYDTKLHDSPHDVWLLVKKPRETEWQRWEGEVYDAYESWSGKDNPQIG